MASVRTMHVTACESADAFLCATEPYRTADPLRTNLLGSIATAVAAGGPWATRFWIVGDGDEVLGAVLVTPPFPVALGPMDDDAAAALGAAVAAGDDDLTGVSGYGTGVESFLAGYRATGTPGSRRRVVHTEHQVLYAATHVEVPDVPGVLAVASAEDLALALEWYDAFASELDHAHHGASEAQQVATRAAVDGGRIRWWRDDGAVVSMAAHAEPVTTPAGTVTRIGPVYTPPERRGHGYAAAVTGRLTESLLAGGSRAMLFADRANPTSNGVYVRLGYEAIDESVRATLAAR